MNFKTFPTTRYQGSKRKILPWIYEAIKDLQFNTVLDVFGGTASVSYLFKKMNKKVTYNDSLRFNYYIGKALIENNTTKLTEDDINALTSVNPNANFNFIQNNFNDIYYKIDENKWLDNIVYNILNMNHYGNHVLEHKKAVSFYALFQACLAKRPFNLFHRKNLSIRKNINVPRSFGNYITWERPFNELFRKYSQEVNSLVYDSNVNCKATNYLASEIPENSYDLLYLDPPYFNKKTTNETSNYLKVYHFLEGLSKYSEWKNLIDFESLNLRFKKNLYSSNFTIETFSKDLESLISKFEKSILVVSYKKGGTPSIETIVKILKKYKKRVYTKSKHYKYALNHQNGNAEKNREVLIVGL